MSYEVYMHGQILGTHSFLLKGEFPVAVESAYVGRNKAYIQGE